MKKKSFFNNFLSLIFSETKNNLNNYDNINFLEH